MIKFETKRQDDVLWANTLSRIANRRMAAAIMLFLLTSSFALPARGSTRVMTATQAQAKSYVPFEDLANLIEPSQKAMLMDRAEFDKLMAQAQANAEKAETLELGQVSRAEYSAAVSGETVTITGKLELISMSDKPVAVPLRFGRMGLSSVTLDKKAAPLGYDSRGRLTVILTAKGQHELEVSGTATLKELTTGGMQFSISIPAAVAGEFVLKAPGDLEIHSTVPAAKPVYDKQTDETTASLTIGSRQNLVVVLLGNGRRDDEKAILLAESATTVTLAGVYQKLSCLYTVQALRRGVRELQFEMPSEWTITEVTCPSLVRWSIGAAQSGQQNQRLTVRLRSAKVGATPLHIKATAERSGLGWGSPRTVLVDAAYQRGFLMVNTEEELRVQTEKMTNARREDAVKTSVTGIMGTSAARLYSHWGDSWSVDLELATLSLRRSVKERQLFEISPEELTLTGEFEITAIDREFFDVSFVLPDKNLQWHVTKIYVNDQESGFEYRIEDQVDKRLLKIELAQPVLAEKLLKVKIMLRNVPSDWRWTADTPERTMSVPLIHTQAQSVSGNAAFSAVGDLDATVTNLPAMLEVVPAGQMTSLRLPQNVQHAYSYKSAVQGDIQLKVSRRQARIAAKAIGLISARPQGVTGNWRITYTISRASAKKLYLLTEKKLGQELRISSRSVRITSRNIVEPGEQTLPLPVNLSERYNLWLLDLDRSILGEVAIDVEYERPLSERDFEAPLIRPVCRENSQNATPAVSVSGNQSNIDELLAVQASEELALTIEGSGLKEIDAIELPPLPVRANRILAAYRLEPPSTAAGSAVALTLKTTVHENYPVPSTLAVSSHLTTYLDPQGRQQTEAVFNVSNAAQQFLAFRLPEDAQLWSLQVAGAQAKPQRNARGDYQVPITKSRAPIPIRIVYAYTPPTTSMSNVQLGGVEIPGVEINQVGWSVLPPPGYTVTALETNLQTMSAGRAVPAYVQLYNFIAENIFTGSMVMPVFKTAGGIHRASISRGRPAGALISASEEQTYSHGVQGDELQTMDDFEAYKGVKRSQLSFSGGTMDSSGVIDGDVEKARSPGKPPVTPGQAMPQEMPELGSMPQPTGVSLGLVREGRFTLPVSLNVVGGSGPRAVFSGLGVPRLTVELSTQDGQDGRWLLGFIFVITIGMGHALRSAKVKAGIVVAVLAVSSLLAVWWPATIYFANGAFGAGLCLVVLYVLVCFVRWLWCRLRFAPATAGKTATAVLLVVSVLGLSPSSAGARTLRRPVQPEKPPTEMVLPPVIFPYDTDASRAEEAKKVLIPYSRFVELWNRANPEDPIDGLKPGTDVSFADVKYHVTTENEKLQLKLTADVTTYGSEWVVIALPTKGLAVTDVTIDGKPAQWQGVGDMKDVHNAATQTLLMLPGGTSGRLELNALASPHFFGRKGDVKFSVPPLPAAVMTVVLGESDLELEVDELQGALTSRTVNSGVEWIVPLGMTRDVSLRWLPKVGATAADRTLSAVSAHEVHFFHWATLGVSRIRYSFSAGEHDRFELYVPAGATLTDLQGANIRDWRPVDERMIENRSFDVIQVRLHRAAKKRYELTARWLASLSALDEPTRLLLIRAGEVGRESGTVTLNGAGGMTVKVAQVAGGRREAIGQRSNTESANSTTAAAKFYWPYRPFALSVQLSRPEVSAGASLDQLIRVDRDQVQLLVQAELKAETGTLFGGNFELPQGYELLSAVGPDVERYFERSAEGKRLVHIKFSSAVRQTKIAFVLMRNDVTAASPTAAYLVMGVNLTDFEVPTITAVDAEGTPLSKQKGRIAVQIVKSLEAQTISSANVKSIAPWVLKDWLNGSQVRAVQFAYSYESPGRSLRLRISPQSTRVHVETFASLVVKTTSAHYAYRLRYDISGSPLDHLRLQMPSQYASLVAVESPTMRSVTKSDGDNGQSQWDIALANEVTGIVDVTVNFALAIDETTKVLTIPRVQTDASDGYHGIVAVQNISRHKILLRETANLEELPASEQRRLLPKEIGKSLQYVYHSYQDDWALSFDFTGAEPASRIQMVVDLLSVTTVIDRSGHCRYEVRIALQNRSEQFLRISVPQGLNLWSAKVASQPVKPVIPDDSAETEVLIPLVKTSPGGLPYEVQLYFADSAEKGLLNALDGIAKLSPPAISIVGAPVTQTTWSLRLPAGYRYVRPTGNMSPVAGTVEMLSFDIEAKLEQLRRLDKTYRDIAGSESQTEQVTAENWDMFNKKLAKDIKHAQRFLESNRGEVSHKDYDRLKLKLGGQVTIQNVLIGGNTAYVQKQQEQSESNINVWLNSRADNGGMGEGIRNSFIMQKPGFVTENEERQIERLNEELRTSERQKLQLQAGNGQAFGGDINKDEVVDFKIGMDGLVLEDTRTDKDYALELNGGSSKADEVKGIMEKLSKENAEQIEKQQVQLKMQMSQISDNRAQRAFGITNGSMAVEQPQSGFEAEGDKVLMVRGKKDLGRRVGRGRRRDSRRGRGGSSEQALNLIGGESQSGITGEAYDEEEALEIAPEGAASLSYGGGAYAYVAGGTYSLPVTLPVGQIRLDFARPMGDAELSIWAIPAELTRKLFAGLVVVIAALAAFAVIKVWPESACRQPMSAKRIVICIIALAALALVLGILGLLVGLAGIVIIETARAATASRPAAA